jgi:hypothetical protein
MLIPCVVSPVPLVMIQSTRDEYANRVSELKNEHLAALEGIQGARGPR